MRARSILAFLFLCLSQPSPASPLGFLDRLLPRDKSGDTASSSQPSGGQKISPPEVYFSPKGGCTEAVVRELANARQTVLVQAYSFTSTSIAAALVSASRRGVRVEAVLDKSNKTGKYSAADFLVNARIPTWIDSSHAIAHNKVMVIDNSTVITGSFNFTKAAEESNAENLIILRSADLSAAYSDQFIRHREHSTPYAGH
jgi:phosphatidylserine/phosphatidylglycerophosphate/cardiolipin synthase-like enzyme